MTMYTLAITTFLSGMTLCFEFGTTHSRDTFFAMFVNSLRHDIKGRNDYVTSVTYGERIFAA